MPPQLLSLSIKQELNQAWARTEFGVRCLGSPFGAAEQIALELRELLVLLCTQSKSDRLF
jgi:hypothetical protein